MSDTRSFTASQRFKNWFGLKNVKFTAEAASPNKGVAYMFLEEPKKLIKYTGCHLKQV
jgi:hypothetical protein